MKRKRCGWTSQLILLVVSHRQLRVEVRLFVASLRTGDPRKYLQGPTYRAMLAISDTPQASSMPLAHARICSPPGYLVWRAAVRVGGRIDMGVLGRETGDQHERTVHLRGTRPFGIPTLTSIPDLYCRYHAD